jgi:tetratricopeptide (TPR) repeat protein
LPDNIQDYLSRAHAAYQNRSFEEAIRLFGKVVEIDPQNDTALHNLGVIHDVARDFGRAEQFYRRALGANPANAATIRNLASLLFDLGSHDESRGLYAQLIDLDADDAEAHFAYSRLTRYRRDDPTLPALGALQSKSRRLAPELRVKLLFALGKARQDLGQYPAAFDAFRAGNELQYARQPFDEASHYAMLADVRRCFDADYFAAQPTSGIEDELPIFVLGMPRSGSTLVEQILATHGDVAAAGEVDYLKQSIQRHLIGDHDTFSAAVPHWTERALRDAAGHYLRLLRRHANGARRVVDKMPGNFAFAGLIAQLFPKAGIVHSVRHPVATLWSIYSTHFGDRLRYGGNLDVLTRYIGEYQATMTHWRSALPSGTIHDVEYERLVRDPEATIRGLLAAVGLDWEPACLDFHETERVVRTASAAQVRRPLYATAVDQWRNYREQLAPYAARLSSRPGSAQPPRYPG